MKKQIKIAYIVAFVLLFITPMLVYEIFGSYLDETNFEQRQAAKKPEFSLQTIDEYPQNYEAYFNDKLPFRNQMITANSLINLRLFQISSVKKVIAGNSGWLFYNPAAKDGDPIADFQGTNLLSNEHLAMFAKNLIKVRDSLQAKGKTFVVLIAPNKECIYGNAYLPARFQTGNTYTRADQVAEYLLAKTDLTVVYPKTSILEAIKTDKDHIYYYKTDTHWNELGAYIGTKELLDSVGNTVPDLDTFDISIEEKKAGDLAGMLGLAEYMKYDNVYALKDYCKGQTVEKTYPIEGNTRLTCYSTSNADPRSVLMVRDSFGTAMMPYLSTQFNNCSFIHRDIFKPEMLQQYPCDIVVLEVVERYIWNLANFKVE